MCHHSVYSVSLIRKVCGVSCCSFALALLGLGLALIPSPSYAQAGGPTRERLSLDADWRFQKGDPADAAGQLNYERIKDRVTLTGSDFKKGAEAPAA